MKNESVIRRSDLWFAAALLAAAAAAALCLWRLPEGSTVVFRQDGKVVARHSLSEDGSVELSGPYHNVFRIAGGSVWVAETDCPNRACAAAGAISAAGEAIICAPNHVSASIEGSEGGLDAYTG